VEEILMPDNSMPDSFLVWLGLGIAGLIALGAMLGLKSREGPTPLSEIIPICGIAAGAAWLFGYPIVIVPILIAAIVMYCERFR
jgi:hypothetical protein